ncbi:hypothetical protein HHK36_029266 [Tetracentron sinense]|uniref:MPN domain-containing protein n=1 Tax=Tetracentron sinense TaxID=13715 RepID=A0A834YH96_TETSI|nr:hypothetical protein HHK36_029266 [Tetracentron sinense]
MGGELRYEIGQNAYIKLVLHALNHKTSAVNGILIGRLVNDEIVEITDAVPLSHSQIGLLPTLEIALIQIEEHFGEKGASVVGYYHANERFDDFELGNIAKNIGDHICRYFPQAALLLIVLILLELFVLMVRSFSLSQLDNRKLEALQKGKDKNPVVQLYTRDTSKSWKQAGSDGSSRLAIKEPLANVVLLDYISSKKWQDIVDFDDHLDDISK